MTYLLDTNILVYARNGVTEVVERMDRAWANADLVTSILVVGEMYGVERSARKAQNLNAVTRQVAMLDAILPITDGVTRRFGALKADLVGRGRTKGDVDLYIAAAALESGAVLVTNDDDLLDGAIHGLAVENWFAR